jgi:hypothetical protein
MPSEKLIEVGGIFFDHEYRGDMFLRNVGMSPSYTAVQSRSPYASKPKMTQLQFGLVMFPMSTAFNRRCYPEKINVWASWNSVPGEKEWHEA